MAIDNDAIAGRLGSEVSASTDAERLTAVRLATVAAVQAYAPAAPDEAKDETAVMLAVSVFTGGHQLVRTLTLSGVTEFWLDTDPDRAGYMRSSGVAHYLAPYRTIKSGKLKLKFWRGEQRAAAPYTDAVVAQIPAQAGSTLVNQYVNAAVETAASFWSRAFASASVSPALPALTPLVLGAIGRGIIERGGALFEIEVRGPRVVDA